MFTKGLPGFSRNGFAVVELLLALVVIGPILLAGAWLTVAVLRSSADEHVTALFVLPGGASSQTKVVSRRPTAGVETDAVIFHSVLTAALRRSIACYAFGAEPQGVVPSTPTGSSVLQIGTLVKDDWIAVATPALKDQTAYDFLGKNPSLGPTAPYDGTGNFSLVVVGPRAAGGNGVTAIAQVIGTPATLSSPATAAGDLSMLVWARLWTSDGYWEYSWIAPRANAANAAWAAKATQYWSWVDEARNIYEPGPVVCRFPDPVTASDAAAGVSRFTYRL